MHVNRTVQHLRQMSMISWNGEALVIKDPERVIQLAEFDGSYLQVLPQRAYLTSLDLVISEMKDAPHRLAAHSEGDSYGRLCEGRLA